MKNGRLLYETDTVCDYYVLGAAKDGYITVFHIYDSVQLKIEHYLNPETTSYQFDAIYRWEGNNSPVEYRWDFGDGSPFEYGSSVTHQFPVLPRDTAYKVSLRAKTQSERYVWASDTACVPGVKPWEEMASVPSEPSGKRVKDGGWLVFNPDNRFVYGAKGNKCGDFYSYNLEGNQWRSLDTLPRGSENKPLFRGSAGCYGDGYIYATKGNNTLGFWKYDIANNIWTQLPDVLRGNSDKKVKECADMVYVVKNSTGYVYLLKYKYDFLRYNTRTNSWEVMSNAPGEGTWQGGSWLVYDGNHTLYAHKAWYHELWTFDINTHTWSSTQLPGMPTYSGKTRKSKKSKDGGSAAFYNGAIYAPKGNNTCEFWKYDISSNTWAELLLMPEKGSTTRKKRVKAGGDIVYTDAEAENEFYALKGNKTREFWRYTPYEGEGAFGLASGDGNEIPKQVVRREQRTCEDAERNDSGCEKDGGEEPIAEGIAAEKPRWRRDGSAVCYSREDDVGWLQVYIVLRDTPNVEFQLTFEPCEHESPVFDSSGNWVAMSMEDSDTNYYQIAKVRASATPGPTIILTHGSGDAENPEWSPSGRFLVFQCYDTLTRYLQLFRIPSGGGEAQQLTFDPVDHELPKYLNENEIVFQRWPDEGYIQIYKLNLITGEQTPLTLS